MIAPLVSVMRLHEKEINELKLEVKKQQENLLAEKVKEIENRVPRYKQCI